MSARIEDLLVGAIAKANKAVEDANAQLEDYQRDVSELEALLASHRLRTTPVDSHPTGAHQLPDAASTLTDPPAPTPKDGA